MSGNDVDWLVRRQFVTGLAVALTALSSACYGRYVRSKAASSWRDALLLELSEAQRSSLERALAASIENESFNGIPVERFGEFRAGKDNRALLQSALDSGEKILLGKRDYTIDGHLNINAPATRLIGQSKGLSSITQLTKNASGLIVSGDNAVLEHFTVSNVRQDDGREYSGIAVNNDPVGVVIANVTIDGSDDSGIRVGYVSNRESKRYGAPATQCSILNCTVGRVTNGSGIELIHCEDVIVSGCRTFDTHQHGVRLAGAKNALVSNNIVHRWGQGGSGAAFQLQGFGTGDGTITRRTSLSKITQNIAHLEGVGKKTGRRTFVNLQDEVDKCFIGSNTVTLKDIKSNTGITAAYFRKSLKSADYSSSDTIFTNNSITGDIKHGIEIYAPCYNLNISNNIMKGQFKSGVYVPRKNPFVSGVIRGNIIRKNDDSPLNRIYDIRGQYKNLHIIT